jgi:hypothetical protein
MLALAVYDRLKAMRRPGDSYSDVIIRCEGMMERAHTGTVGPPFLLALVNGGSDGARPNP